ncbi:hypothetical protein VP01_2085g2 [Puccinia sorghi]|uniref:Uncharacterized protein n=1 Tax=Puccinia sorghi TaxID=27349 RepID=A0A0L6VAK2_9BASI|nr:hypothetical protein VP01_2085g2 [Puccinia sorghi]
MQNTPAKLPSKLHLFAYGDVLEQSLCIKAWLNHSWKKLGVTPEALMDFSACQLQTIKDKKPDTIISKTTDTDPMDKLYSILHKTTIDSIPILTEEDFLIWCSIVVNLLELLKIKTTLLSEDTKLTPSEELILCTLMSLIVPIRNII